VADDAREEEDEGVHHALDERQRHHVTVGHVAEDRCKSEFSGEGELQNHFKRKK